MASKNKAKDKPVDVAEMASHDFTALFAKEDLQRLEEIAKGFAVDRRLLQAMLASGKSEILGRVDEPEKSADIFFEMLERAKDYKDHLKGLMEQAETAELRIMCVVATLCEQNAEAGAEVAQ